MITTANEVSWNGPFWRALLLPLGVMLLSQCGTTHSIDRGDPQAWNEGVAWKPRPGSAQDFVPVDFNGPAVAATGKGEWMTDPQDGYRFYVPASGTKKYPPGMLRAEAIKATNELTRAEQGTRNTLKTVFFPVSGVLWMFTADHSGGGGGGGGGNYDSGSSDAGSNTDTSRSCHDHSGHDGGCKSDGGGGAHGK